MKINKFIYKYETIDDKTKREVSKIRQKYLPKSENESKIKLLNKLNKKVQVIPTIVAIILGILGVLIFGLGLTMVLEWSLFLWGILVSLVGFIPSILAYPVYTKLHKILKDKYGETIINLSNEILSKNDK